jgi:hypothetical protein
MVEQRPLKSKVRGPIPRWLTETRNGRVAQFGRRSGFKYRQVWVQIPPRPLNAGSSNGRTTVSGTVNRSSTLCPAAAETVSLSTSVGGSGRLRNPCLFSSVAERPIRTGEVGGSFPSRGSIPQRARPGLCDDLRESNRPSRPAGLTTLHMWLKCTECKQEFKVGGQKFTAPTMFRSGMRWLQCFDCWLARHPTPTTRKVR